MEHKRSQWASNIGFILAAAGSAVGLGNIWKFPGKVAAGGGGLDSWFRVVPFCLSTRRTACAT